MTVYAYTNFSKRENSTKVPANTPGSYSSLTVVWKENTSVENPSILLTRQVNANYTYFYIVDWKMYYFVTDIIQVANAVYQFDLKLDVLASFKTNIGSTVAMIMRSSTGYNEWIPDPEVYVSTQKTIARTVDSQTVGFADPTGVFLLTVINEDGCATGFAAQYFDNASGLHALATYLMNSTFVQDVMKYSSNVSACIVSLKWMPFSYSNITTSSFVTLDNYKVSNVSFTSAGYRITGDSYFLDGATTIAIPWRSDKDFREASPYTTARLLIPMYGFVDLNASDMVGATNLYIQYRADRSTGDVIVIINKDSAGEVLQTIQFNVAVEMPVATLTRNIGGAVSAISGGINNAIGIAAGNYVGGAAGLISNAASFALNANGRSVSLKGNLQGKAALAYGNQFQLFLYAPHTLDPTNANFIATKGRPCQYVDTISNHSGFVQCADASVASTNFMSMSAQKEINGYLNSGFYYE